VSKRKGGGELTRERLRERIADIADTRELRERELGECHLLLSSSEAPAGFIGPLPSALQPSSRK
jgi:hypothetical protein